MVIAVGLVNSNWILAMDAGHSVVVFMIIGGTVGLFLHQIKTEMTKN